MIASDAVLVQLDVQLMLSLRDLLIQSTLTLASIVVHVLALAQ